MSLTQHEPSIDPLTPIPIPADINEGLTSAKNSTMLQILGMPRDTVDNKCRMPTNKPLVDLIVTDDVGPFRVTGMRLAVASLKRVMTRVQEAQPQVFSLLGTAGMACVRFIAGSNKLSNHSWGCAIEGCEIGDCDIGACDIDAGEVTAAVFSSS